MARHGRCGGPYRRVEGFNIDAMLLFEGVRKAG